MVGDRHAPGKTVEARASALSIVASDQRKTVV